MHAESFATMENEFYYLDDARQPQGPLSFEALKEKVQAGHLPPQVQVARKGDARWVTFAELSALPQPCSAGVSALPVAPGAQGGVMPPKPDNNLVWAILCTVLCCLPLGVVAIIKASAVDGLYAQGRYEEALQSARSARNWSIWGAAAFFVITVFYVLALVAAAVSGS